MTNRTRGALDRRYLCIDRGGMVVSRSDGSVILDLLTTEPIISQTVLVEVEFVQSHHGERSGWDVDAWREK